jgi:ribonucleases P/MRP protein subunit RPP40
MHIGSTKDIDELRSFTLTSSDITRTELKTTTEERDLGIILTPDFKFSAQSAHAASKANSMLAMLRHTFMSRDVETWSSLYRTYIRPHLEFAISAWNPLLKRDIKMLEKVQRRVTRFPTVLKNVEYHERLVRMKLTSLETRRRRGDLIQLYKCLRGSDSITWSTQPVWSEPRGPRRKQLRREIVRSCQPRQLLFKSHSKRLE